MFDIGVNLTSSQFSHDRDDVIARAQAAGVSGMLLTGPNRHESEEAQQLAQRFAAGPLRVCIRTIAAAGTRRWKRASVNWRSSRK